MIKTRQVFETCRVNISTAGINEYSGRYRRSRIRSLALLIGWLVHFRHDSRTARTGSFAFLLPPAAVRANGAGRQAVHHNGQHLGNPHRKAALRAIEVLAGALCTRRRNPEDLGRLYGLRKGQHFLRDRLRHSQVGNLRLFGRTTNDAEYKAAVHFRLGAGAERPITQLIVFHV
jgi:hypothetical protein